MATRKNKENRFDTIAKQFRGDQDGARLVEVPHPAELIVRERQDMEEAEEVPQNDLDRIVEEEDETAASEISRVCAELGNDAHDAKVSIYRMKPDSPREFVFVDEISPREFSMKHIADNYGGGRYNVRVYVPKKILRDGELINAGVRLAKNARIDIDGEPRIARRANDAVPASNSGVSQIDKLGELIVKSSENLARIIIESRPKEKSTKEILEEMQLLQNLMGGNRQPQIDPFSMFEKFSSLMASMRPIEAKGGAGEMIALAREFGPMFKQLMTSQQPSQNSASLPAPENAPVPEAETSPAIEAKPEANSQTEDQEAMKLIYKGYVTLMVEQASHNNDVQPVAEQVYEMATDELLEWLHRETFLEELSAFNSKVKLYPQWFGRLRDAILKLESEDEEREGE